MRRPGRRRRLWLKGVRHGIERAPLKGVLLGGFLGVCFFETRCMAGALSFSDFRQKGGVGFVALHLGLVLLDLSGQISGFLLFGARNGLAVRVLGGGA